MAYSTTTQFLDRFGRDEAVALTNLDSPLAEEVNESVIVRARVDASALIDSYLAGRFSLPFASPPQVLAGKELDVIRYFLERGNPREDVRQRYEDAIRWLEMVAKGLIQLGLNADSATVTAPVQLVQTEAGTKVFTDATLGDFVGE